MSCHSKVYKEQILQPEYAKLISTLRLIHLYTEEEFNRDHNIYFPFLLGHYLPLVCNP